MPRPKAECNRFRGETMRKEQMPVKLPTKAEECQTLMEWRELVLGKSQAQIALAAEVSQARVSQVERGHVPRRRHWPSLMHAYQLQGREPDFYRLVMAAPRLKALQTPMSESEPLLATGRKVEEHREQIIRDEGRAAG